MSKKYIKNALTIAIAASLLLGVAITPAVENRFGVYDANAQFNATNTKALVTDAITDWGDVAIVVLGAVLAVFALLLAAGFGISRLRRYIHGRKV